MKKSLFVSIAAVVAFVMLAACSDDSGVDNGAGGSSGLNTELQKSSDYEVGVGSCGGGHLEKRAEWGDESVDFVMNEDGSATFTINTTSVCGEYGHVTDVKLERKEDSLFVHDFFEYYPDDPQEPKHNCLCFADYRIKVPAEYIGVKYLNFKGVYDIVYKEQE